VQSENGAGADAPAGGQTTRGCIEEEEPGRRRYQEVLLIARLIFSFLRPPPPPHRRLRLATRWRSAWPASATFSASSRRPGRRPRTGCRRCSSSCCRCSRPPSRRGRARRFSLGRCEKNKAQIWRKSKHSTHTQKQNCRLNFSLVFSASFAKGEGEAVLSREVRRQQDANIKLGLT